MAKSSFPYTEDLNVSISGFAGFQMLFKTPVPFASPPGLAAPCRSHSPASGGGGCFFLGSLGAALGTSFLGGAVLGGCGVGAGAGWAACLLDFLEAGAVACLGSGPGAEADPSSLFSSACFRGGGSLLIFLGTGSSRIAGGGF